MLLRQAWKTDYKQTDVTGLKCARKVQNESLHTEYGAAAWTGLDWTGVQ